MDCYMVDVWLDQVLKGIGVIGVDTGGGDFLNILSTGNVHLKRNRFVTMMPLFMVMWILMGLQML